MFALERHWDVSSTRSQIFVPVCKLQRPHHFIDRWSFRGARVPASLDEVLHLSTETDVISVLRELRSSPS